jgi:hypothetical protein
MENKIIFKVKAADKGIKKEKVEDVKVEDAMSDKYIKQLNPLELIAYEIAKSRLKTSFDIEKSIGFIGFNR